MATFGVYILFLQEKLKQQNVREDGTKPKRRKKERRIKQIEKGGIR